MATAVDVNITIDGKKLDGFIDLSVRQDIYSHHTCDLYCRIDAFDKFAASAESFVIEKAQDLIGKKIKIEISPLGKNNATGKNCVIFIGFILEISGSKFQDAFSGSIHIKGASNDILLDGEHHCRSFENKNLDDIVKEITKAYSTNLFSKTYVSSTYQEVLPYVVQYNESNFEFLLRLAKKHGEWLLVTGDNQLFFGQPPSNKAKLIHGKDLHEFTFSMKLVPLKFNYSTFDYFNENKVQKNANILQLNAQSYLKTALDSSNDFYTNEENFYHNYPVSKDEADSELEEAIKTDKRSRVARLNLASGSSDNCELILGGTVKVDSYVDTVKPPKIVNYGEYRIISLFHSFDEGGNYTNQFNAVPLSIEVPPQTNPYLFPVCETQSALVTNTDDPDNLGRIRVRFYWQINNEESPWIRVLTPYAGDNKGIFFIPEVGEEVLIGFENHNAEKPFVTGAHYNGKNKPDDWKSDKNYKKAIRTKSGHTIEFNDENGKEEITIYDKDQKNTIILSSHSDELKIIAKGRIQIQADKNIDITSTEDINIKAKNFNINTDQNLVIDVGGKNDISVTQDYTLEAMNINKKAKIKLAMEASAMADLKASIIKIG